MNLILSGIRIQTVFENLFSNLHKTNQSINFNFNGNLKINLNEINNRLFENLVININFLDEKISLNNSSLNLKKIGKINFSDPLFYEKNQNLEKENALKFAKKRNLINGKKDYEKKLAKMARAGFSYEISKEILK